MLRIIIDWEFCSICYCNLRIIFDQEKNLKNLSFEYEFHPPYESAPSKLNFNFTKTDYLPYRINVLIGKNGVGKTNLLSKLANSLSGYTDNFEKNVFGEQKRPPIDRVMSVSYSAFDSFRKPDTTNDKRAIFSYVYCGIQSEAGTLSLKQLQENFRISYEKVISRNRYNIWHDILAEVLERNNQYILNQIIGGSYDDIEWSSGQHILISTITEIIANMENESIILFDEPEIHLHPNAISNMMRMFHRLLNEYNSIAIFATHSPIILQEIPSRYIQILEKDGINLNIRKPAIECFGNNISKITAEVFDVSILESNYKNTLKMLSENLDYDEVSALFDDQLSLNSLMFLKTCYKKGDPSND